MRPVKEALDGIDQTRVRTFHVTRTLSPSPRLADYFGLESSRQFKYWQPDQFYK